MSFIPTSTVSLDTSLYGAGEPVKLLRSPDIKELSEYGMKGDRDIDQDLYKREIHGPSEDDKKNRKSYVTVPSIPTIILIIISAIIFVTAVSIYDVFRSKINNYYAKINLEDPRSYNNREDIARTELANDRNLLSNIAFAIFAIIIAIILIPILIYMSTKLSQMNT